MVDRVALTTVIVFLVAKATHRKHLGRPALKLDDLISAAQLYAAILAIRSTPVVPMVPVVGESSREV